MVPFMATVIVVAVGILVICVAYNRRRGSDSGRNSKDVYCMFVSDRLEPTLIDFLNFREIELTFFYHFPLVK